MGKNFRRKARREVEVHVLYRIQIQDGDQGRHGLVRSWRRGAAEYLEVALAAENVVHVGPVDRVGAGVLGQIGLIREIISGPGVVGVPVKGAVADGIASPPGVRSKS